MSNDRWTDADEIPLLTAATSRPWRPSRPVRELRSNHLVMRMVVPRLLAQCPIGASWHRRDDFRAVAVAVRSSRDCANWVRAIRHEEVVVHGVILLGVSRDLPSPTADQQACCYHGNRDSSVPKEGRLGSVAAHASCLDYREPTEGRRLACRDHDEPTGDRLDDELRMRAVLVMVRGCGASRQRP